MDAQGPETSTVTAATEDDQNESRDEGDMQDYEGENNNLGENEEEKDSEIDDAEEDGEDEEEEDEAEEVVEGLTGAIKDELQDLLDSSFAVEGTFASINSWSATPQPTINVDGFGAVGLPLSIPEAQRLCQAMNRAPFGKGERTVVDVEVRDTWELDPSHVTFDNPKWDHWLMNEVVPRVCSDLGTTNKTIARLEFYKMLLYETGSHFLPHQDTEKSPGMFATIVIVLPSQFAGGEVHVSHGKQSKVFDFASASLTDTTVLSWYTDVVHEVRPVTSGYRFALSYNLMHTPTSKPQGGDAVSSLPPTIPELDGPMNRLERILKAWKSADAHGLDPVTEEPPPVKLAYILDHEYSHANLSFDKLKGLDAARVLNLRDVCTGVGFRVGLGSLHCTRSGVSDDDMGYFERRHWHDEDDEDEDERMGGGYSMAEVNYTTITVQLIAGPNGESLGTKEHLSEEELMIDEDYWENVGPDDEDYEGYQGNGAGSLEYFYHRSVVLIWPDTQNTSVIASLGGSKVAIKTLTSSSSLAPTEEELDFVEIVATVGSAAAGQLIADSAVRWKDPVIWTKAVDSCRAGSDIAVFGTDRLVQACQTFAWPVIMPVLENVISNTTSTSERLNFVKSLETHFAHEAPTQPLPRPPSIWFNSKRAQILGSLRKVEGKDISFMVSAATTLGGLAHVKDIIFPQLMALNLKSDWWCKFIHYMVERKRTQDDGQSEGCTAALYEAAVPVFEKALAATGSFQKRFTFIDHLDGMIHGSAQWAEWCENRREWAVQTLQAPAEEDVPILLKLIKRDSGLLQEHVLPKLAEHASVSFWLTFLKGLISESKSENNALPSDWTQSVRATFTGPFSRILGQYRTNQQLLDTLNTFGHTLRGQPDLYDVVSGHRKLALESLKHPTVGEAALLAKEVQRKPTLGPSIILPQLRKFDCGMDFWKSFIRAVHSHAAAITERRWTSDELTAFLKDLVETAIFQNRVEAIKPQGPAYNYGAYARSYYPTAPRTPPLFDVVKDILSLCIETNNTPSALQILKKVLAVTTNEESITTTLVPLFPIVVSLLNSHDISRDTYPFDYFFREGVKTFVVYFITPKPSPTKAEWRGGGSSCICGDCGEVGKLLRGSGSQVTWHAALARRKHVEDKLRGQPGLTFETVKGPSPHGLRITKSAVFTEVAVWKDRNRTAMALLQSVGKEAPLKKIWASEDGGLARILAAISGDVHISKKELAINRPSQANPTSTVVSSRPQPSTSSTSTTSRPSASSVSHTKRRVPLPIVPHRPAGSSRTKGHTRPVMGSSVAPSNGGAVASGSRSIPQKRKAYGPVDIDLTLSDSE